MLIPTSPDFILGETIPVRFTCDGTMSRWPFAKGRPARAEEKRTDIKACRFS